MRDREFEDELSAQLRSLPRQRASAGFTDRVLADLDRGAGRPRPGMAWRRAAVPLLALLALAGLWLLRPRPAPRATAEQLRREHRLLAEELASLRALRAAQEPVVYLGGSDEVDLVFDLERFAESNQGGGQVLPAADRP